MSRRYSDMNVPVPSNAVARAEELYEKQLDTTFRQHDRLFGRLFLLQWVCAIVMAFTWSPYAWEGKTRSTHTHVIYAIFFGAALTIPALVMIRRASGTMWTRQLIAVSQSSWSALLIHLTGGRIETHFHIFVSLAFLAFYTDWKVIVSAAAAVIIDHLCRGLLWAESVYGITNPESWRIFEHAFWVSFECVALILGIRETRRSWRELAVRQAALESANEAVEAKVAERTEDLAASRELYRALLETTKTVPWELDPATQRFTYVGPQIEQLLGFPPDECTRDGFLRAVLHSDDAAHARKTMMLVRLGSTCDVEVRAQRADGSWLWVRMIGTLVSAKFDGTGRDPDWPASVLRGVMFDTTERREMERQLNQSQKLESVGRLASGIAHEINTPVQFITDSIHFVRDATADLGKLVNDWQELTRAVVAGQDATPVARRAEKREEEIEVGYILENIPKALDRSIDGLNRVTTIVQSMRAFAHPDQHCMSAVDLNDAIESTLTIARNEYKYVADVRTDYGDIPTVICHVSDVNQAVLNIIVNAAHAIQDVVEGTEHRGLITVRTRLDGDTVVITIADTGRGIPVEIRDRVFDPFFTTKEVGRGTGQGLAIARAAIVDKHHGQLTFTSEPNRGTTFTIRLPLAPAPTRLEGAVT